MLAIICRRCVGVPRKNGIFVGAQLLAPQTAILANSFSSQKSPSSSDVNGGEPDQGLTVSYLINSCGLSSNDAVTVSKKLCIKSQENADAVLELLRKYGFTISLICRLVTRWPLVLHSCPNKTLLPKLEFFRSIGVSDAVSAKTLAAYPTIFHRSLEKHLVFSYNYFKSLVQSDKKAADLFARAPTAFSRGSGCITVISSNIATLRERGVPESSITSVLSRQPSLLMLGKQSFTSFVDRAIEMGFDKSKIVFVLAIEVFGGMSESTLKHKMEVYRRYGMSESDINAALLKHPLCMKLSEEKIRLNMDFLVNELGLKPVTIAESPWILSYSLDKRMKPRWMIYRMLDTNGLLKKSIAAVALLQMPEKNFVKRYIVDHQENFPHLLDIYQGKMSLHENGFKSRFNYI